MRSDGPVVIAVDGSVHSTHTVAWGLAEAVRRRAEVVLTRWVDDPWVATVWSWYPLTGDLGMSADVEAKQYLENVRVLEEARHPGLRIGSRLVHGAVIPGLREQSETAQLLVVGAAGADERGRVGSVGTHVAAHARCDVAVVRPSTAATTAPEARVAVGVDGSPASLVAAQIAAHEAWMRGCALLVVHARPTVPDPFALGLTLPPLATDDPRDPTHRAALDVAQQLRDANPGLEVQLELVDDDPAHALVGLARTARLLVVGSRGLGAFRGMVQGSVSADVVRAAGCTVLVVHDRD